MFKLGDLIKGGVTVFTPHGRLCAWHSISPSALSLTALEDQNKQFVPHPTLPPSLFVEPLIPVLAVTSILPGIS
jgi:hypothetical protein